MITRGYSRTKRKRS